MGDYPDLMRQLEEVEGEEEHQWIMQQIIQILRDQNFPSDDITQHIWVSWKRLSCCDMRRLLMKRRHVESRILPRLYQNEDVNAGVPVIVYGVDGRPHNMTFKSWRPCSYVLTGGWRDFWDEYAFHIKDYITLWLCRQRHTRRRRQQHRRLRLCLRPRPIPNYLTLVILPCRR